MSWTNFEDHIPPRFDFTWLLFKYRVTCKAERVFSYSSKINWTIFTSSGSGSGYFVSSFQRKPIGIRAPFHNPFSARSSMIPVTRSDVMFLSSSAKIKMIFNIASPMAVEVSNCSFIEIKVTRWSFNSSYMAAKSRRFLEILSTFQTMICENSPALTRFIISWKCGRSVFFAE